MFYVYILFSDKDNGFYIGFTAHINQRLKKHQDGEVFSTKTRRPLHLIYYEAHRNKYDALRRERYFKSNKGRTTIKTILRESLHNIRIK